jgi:hypothetical protein
MNPHDLCWKPAHELARMIRAKDVSPVEVVDAVLARRIEAAFVAGPVGRGQMANRVVSALAGRGDVRLHDYARRPSPRASVHARPSTRVSPEGPGRLRNVGLGETREGVRIPTPCFPQNETPGWGRALEFSIEMTQPMCLSRAFWMVSLGT